VRPELKPLLWVGAATLAAVLLVLFFRNREDVPAGPAGRAETAEAHAAPGRPARERAAPRPDAEPLPWQRPSGEDTAPGRGLAAGAPGAAPAMDRAQLLAAMQVQLERNQAAADTALQRIDEVQASGQAPPGVDLDALRENLMIAKQAQALAMELARTNSEPDTPARDEKIASIVGRLQALQARLQRGTAAGPAPAPASRSP